jgi:hypothetical protein
LQGWQQGDVMAATHSNGGPDLALRRASRLYLPRTIYYLRRKRSGQGHEHKAGGNDK